MPWFGAALILVLAALILGVTPWRERQAAIGLARNADRYAAWRGRASGTRPSAAPPLTPRLLLAFGLGAAAGACALIGLVVG